MCPGLRLAAAQNPRARRLQPVARRQNILDLIADMVNAPAGFFARNPAIGEASPSGCSSSILVFGRSMKTTVTP